MDKKYNIIYADPPWRFKTYSKKGKAKKSAENHYATMTLEEIQNLPVEQLAADDCILFLWGINTMLPEALETIKAWGFSYKTIAYSWYKQNKVSDSFFFGLGYWTRQNTEYVLLATKGKPQRISKRVSQVISWDEDWYDTEQILAKIGEHSKKPAIVRHKIVELCGDLPRVELFAREKVDGWDSWGNEIASDVDMGIPKLTEEQFDFVSDLG